MTIQEGNTTPGVPEFQLGVLLVHGIGTQRPGDTLVRWGDVLLKTIERATRKEVEATVDRLLKTNERATRNGVVATVERAGPDDGPGKGRFEAEVLLRADDRTERWLLSECWWAAQSKLTATVGDSFAFVESPVRAALIRTCILDGLEQLKRRRCKHTVIVAHSQGAAAVMDALGGMTLEPDKKRTDRTPPRDRMPIEANEPLALAPAHERREALHGDK